MHQQLTVAVGHWGISIETPCIPRLKITIDTLEPPTLKKKLQLHKVYKLHQHQKIKIALPLLRMSICECSHNTKLLIRISAQTHGNNSVYILPPILKEFAT